MPTALILTIRPQAAADVPAHLGRAAHAAVLRLINAHHPDLASRLHDEVGPKPLTVSSVSGIAGRSPTARVSPAQTHSLRVTLLTPELEQAAAAWEAATLPPIDLDGHLWQVEAVARTPEEHPWAGSASYEQLAGPALARAADPPRRWDIEFAAPVTFRQRGMNAPLPTPDLVFGSLLDKWNAFAPLALPEEVRRFATECMAVSRFELRSAPVPAKAGAMQVGAVGLCSYTAVNRDRYWMACVDVLAHLAFYSGVGAATARGLGQARLREG